MKLSLISLSLIVAVVSCGGGSSNQDNFQGNWIEQSADGLEGNALSVSGDNYVSSFIVITSATTANVQTEGGTFASGPDEFDTFPTKSTCAGAHSEAVQATLSGDTLVLGLPQGIITFQKNGAEPAANFVLTYGCFDTGTFVPSNLSPVSQ